MFDPFREHHEIFYVLIFKISLIKEGGGLSEERLVLCALTFRHRASPV